MPPSSNQDVPPAVTPQPVAPSDNTTLMGILAYLGPLLLIPYLTAKDNAFVRFHLKQGIVLCAIYVALYIISSMMFFSFMIWQLLSLINLGCFILSIIGIINVVHKKEVELPIVGQLAKHVPL